MSIVGPEAANPRVLPRRAVAVCGLLVTVGVFSFLAGLASDADTAWRAYHVNYLYFATLSQGGQVLASALVIVGARWAGPVRHVAEGLAAWVPITFVLGVIGFLGRESIYGAWLHGPPVGKEPWLNITRMFATDVLILGVMAILTLRFLRLTFRPALHGAAQGAPAARRWFERWTANWQGDEAERDESAR